MVIEGAPAAHRFVALDSLRGVCALVVVLYHLQSTSPLTTNLLAHNGFLFVDFFFVLSGFVLAASYGRKLRAGFSIRAFMLLRLGRVYPLHLAMLGLFLIIEIALAFAQSGHRPPFTGSRTVEGLVENLFLVQIFGWSSHVSWNWVSWSIAAEVWTYLIFAIVQRTVGFSRVLYLATAAACAAWLWWLGPPFLDRTFDYALVRAVLGFALGVVTFLLVRVPATDAARVATTLAEAVAIVLAVALVVVAGRSALSLACPFVFALVVAVFARGGGSISTLLRGRVFRLGGTLSYAIYMVHPLVIGLVGEAADRVGHRLGVTLVARPLAGNQGMKMFAGSPWTSSLLVCLAVLAVLIAAQIVHWLVEEPFRNRSRALVARYFNVSGKPA